MRAFIGNRSREIWFAIGVACLLLAWEHVSGAAPALLPRLGTVVASLTELCTSGELHKHLAVSLHRSVSGLAIGTALGFVTGVAAGFSRPAYYMFKPAMGALFASPAVVVVMLAMVWFGVGSGMAVFVTALFTVPIMYVSVVEGMAMVDRDLLEMAAVYRLSKWHLWWQVYLPALSTAVLTGFSFAAGSAFRKTVMAELLGSSNGVGFAMAMTRFNLDVARFFAWVAVCLLVALAIELVLVRPIVASLCKWRAASAAGATYE